MDEQARIVALPHEHLPVGVASSHPAARENRRLHRRHGTFGASRPHEAGSNATSQRQRPHVRIVPGAWLNQAVFEGPKCRKCGIRPSYSASASGGKADELCADGARCQGVLGLADSGAGGVGAPEDGLLQDRRAPLERLLVGPRSDRSRTRVSFRSIGRPWRRSLMISAQHSVSTISRVAEALERLPRIEAEEAA
jgi:hypothetical protein